MSSERTDDEARRTCHYCDLPIPDDDTSAMEATTKNAWAHFTCWYDGGPFEREQLERAAVSSTGNGGAT